MQIIDENINIQIPQKFLTQVFEDKMTHTLNVSYSYIDNTRVFIFFVGCAPSLAQYIKWGGEFNAWIERQCLKAENDKRSMNCVQIAEEVFS